MEKLQDLTLNKVGQTSCLSRLGLSGVVAGAAEISSYIWLVGALYLIIVFEIRSLLTVGADWSLI